MNDATMRMRFHCDPAELTPQQYDSLLACIPFTFEHVDPQDVVKRDGRRRAEWM